MKTWRTTLIILIISLIFSSCEEYLEKTPKADISEDDVFSTYIMFNGYVEMMYQDIVNPVHTVMFSSVNNGDDIIPSNKYRGWIEGDYFWIMGSGNSVWYNVNATRTNITNLAYWQSSWFGIRAANTALANLHRLLDATQEQKAFIEGQAYFFRGYFHFELMRSWGNVPYIDTVFAADSEMKVPQMGLYVTAEKILADLQKAADLLPVDWDLTETGQITSGKNEGRITKGMTQAVMADVLLHCGSPLWHGTETGNYTYNVDYCKRAADMAWNVIKLANEGRYALVPWERYSDNFYVMNKDSWPVTTETIFPARYKSDTRYQTSAFTSGHHGTDSWMDCPPQNYIEYYEMANGFPIEDPESGHDLMNPWVNRDPRFKYNIAVDRDRQVVTLNDARAFYELYIGGRERTGQTSLTGFIYRKYWNETINRFDNGWNNYIYAIPKLRLADVYLFYAEAANEGYNGPNGKSPDANLTAVDAVNIVRARALMPNVKDKFLVSKEAFRERVYNERAVELGFEHKRWFDLRRWYVHHLPKHKELYELQFDKNHTYFNRVLARTIAFSDRHYWLPFPVNQVTLYPEFKQNPGW